MINTFGHVNWLQEGSKLLSHLVNDSGETRFNLLIEKLPNKAVNQIKMQDIYITRVSLFCERPLTMQETVGKIYPITPHPPHPASSPNNKE